MKKYKVIILIVFILVLGLVFYFQKDIMRVYDYFGIRVQQTESTDIGSTIKEVAKEILTVPPLNVGGKENQVVLVKEKILAQTNIQRHDNGNFLQLVESTKLDVAAKAKAEDMFKNQYFEHISPSGVNSGQLVKSFGYEYLVTGENLILGNFTDEQELVQDWMASPSHRANILNTRFTEIGVAVVKGIYKGKATWMAVQEFGLPLSNCGEPSFDIKSKIDVNKSQLDQLSLQISDKKKEIDTTDLVPEIYNTMVDKYNALVSQYNTLNIATKKLISQYNIQVNAFNDCVAGK